MKKVVLFALIAALCAGVLLYFYLGKLEAQKEVKIEYDSVVVAAVDIPAFTPITSDMLQFQQIPQGYAHPQAARTMEEAVGFLSESEIAVGEQLLTSKLKEFGETDSGLSYIVPTGMRALTIAVDEITGVAGFLQRGDFVDVITYTTTSYQPEQALVSADGETVAAQQPQSQSTTLVAAQNVRIAAIGLSLSNTNTPVEGDPAMGYNSVTLLLTPEDAMRVIQGARSGAVVLVLRASGDHDPNLEEPIVNDQLLIQAK